MRIIIAGSRAWTLSIKAMEDILCQQLKLDPSTIKEVVVDGELGISRSGENWARYHKINVRTFSKGNGTQEDQIERMIEDIDLLIWMNPGTSALVKAVLKMQKQVLFPQVCR